MRGTPGRPPVFSDAAIQFCLSIKMLFKLALREIVGMVASLLRLTGLDWPVPDYSTLCRRQKTLMVQIPYCRVGDPVRRRHVKADEILHLVDEQRIYGQSDTQP